MEDIQFHPIYCEKTILPGEKSLKDLTKDLNIGYLLQIVNR